MVYMGSKTKYANHIVPILQKAIDDNNVNTYIECFVGGANIIDKIKCENRIGYDRSDTLIALLIEMEKDFNNVLPDCNRELWDKGKGYVKDGIMPEDMTLAEIGAVEFFGSFSNGGFPRGYAQSNYCQAYKNAKEQAKNLKDIKFKCQNYWELDEDIEGAVIYLDPPYQGTKQYGYARQDKMDYNHFWDWVRKISKKNYVFVSEQNGPEDFEVIWGQNVKRTCHSENNYKATEKLFKYKEGK